MNPHVGHRFTRNLLSLILITSAWGLLLPGAFPSVPSNDEIPFFAMQMHSLQWGVEGHRKAVDLMEKAGVKLGRDECYWSNVEKEKGVIKIQDEFFSNVDYCKQHGIDLLIILNYANKFYDNDCAPTSAEGLEAYANYCRKVVEATRGKIRYFEVWNEPNIDGFWRPFSDAKAYARLLKIASKTIREVNPNAVIVAPALSGINVEFLKNVLDEGVYDCFDVLSLHPYSHPASPEDAKIFERLDELQETLKKYGAPKHIWITEMGYHTANLTGVGEEDQAAYISRFYLLAMTRPYIQSIFWYWFGPDGPDADYGEDRFGIIRKDYSLKPAYLAYQTLADNLTGAQYQRSLLPESARPLRAYEFQNKNKYYTAIWREKDQEQIVIHTHEQITIYPLDATQQFMQPYRRTKEIYLTVSSKPILIESKKSLQVDRLDKNYPRMTLKKNFDTLVPTEQRIWNLKSKGELSQCTINIQSLDTKKLECIRIDSSHFKIVVPLEAPMGSAYLKAEITEMETKPPFFSQLEKVEIAEPYEFVIYPLFPKKDKREFEIQITNNSSLQLNGNIRFDSLIKDFDIEPKECDFNKLKPQKVFTQKLAWKSTAGISSMWELNPDLLFPLSINVNLENGLNREFEAVNSYYVAPHVKSINVDGDLSDWDVPTSPIQINKKEQQTGGYRTWKGLHDSQARVWVAWNKEWFYFATELEDDHFSAPNETDTVWRNDGFEVYFDIDRIGDMTNKRYNEDDYQYGFFPTKDNTIVWRWTHGNKVSPGARIAINRHTLKENSKTSREFTGLIMEGAIPMSEIALNPKVGKMIGFNVAYTDDDDPNYSNPFMQEIQMSWSGRKNAWSNPHSQVELFFGD